MNYTREQAEEVLRDFNVCKKVYRIPFSARISFLDHKFPKKVSGWYRTAGNADWLVYHDFEMGITYGFGTFGKWFKREDILEYSLEDDYLATPQEVEQRLIEEAMRRGYKDAQFRCLKGFDRDVYFQYHYNSKIDYVMPLDKNELWISGLGNSHLCIFNNGKWAEIIEQPETIHFKGIEELAKTYDVPLDSIGKGGTIGTELTDELLDFVMRELDLNQTIKKAEKIVEKLNHLLSLHHS